MIVGNEIVLRLAVGLTLTALVWAARRLLGPVRLPAASVPQVLAGVAIALAVIDLVARGRPWHEALATGLLTAGAAGGLWSMLGRHLLPLPVEKKP